MDVLLKAHPLYSELVRLDDDVAVLELQGAGAAAHRSGERIAQETQAMRGDLQSAQERTQKELAEKRSAYIKRENAAITRIFAQSEVSAQSADAVEEQIALSSREQVENVGEQARKSFQEYRLRMIAQSDAALASVRQALLDRAARAYRRQEDAYAQQEAAFTLEQERKDAIERLLLRAELADLALDKQAKAQTQARLDALGKKEADDLKALHDRDRAALALYREQLRDRTRKQEAEEEREMRARTNAKLSDYARQMQIEVLGQLRTVAPPPRLPAVPAGALPPALREKLDALRKRYQAAYTEDAEQTVREFAKTREQLSARFERLAGIDAAAQENARKEIEGLRRQREDLYGQMVAQIDREVKILAGRRGIGTVVTKVDVSVGGVDLTRDAAESIESLHE
jgi:hypothetical protein